MSYTPADVQKLVGLDMHPITQSKSRPLVEFGPASGRASAEVELPVQFIRWKLLEAFILPPGSAGMSAFRSGSAFDLVDLGWFQTPGAVATEIRTDSTFFRRYLALPRSDSILFRHYLDTLVVNLRFQ